MPAVDFEPINLRLLEKETTWWKTYVNEEGDEKGWEGGELGQSKLYSFKEISQWNPILQSVYANQK
jgi:hypothetical protein